MIHLNRPYQRSLQRPSGHAWTLCTAGALIIFLTFSQPAHSSNIWLWSWLGITGVQTVRAGDCAAKDPADAARTSKAARNPVVKNSDKSSGSATILQKSPA